MKWITLIVSVALIASVLLNLLLWDGTRSRHGRDSDLSAADSPSNQITNSDTSLFKFNRQDDNNSQQNQTGSFTSKTELNATHLSPQQQIIFRIKQQIAAGQSDAAQHAIQDLLRAEPDNIEYVLLEAFWIRSTAHISDTLSHHYGLLDLALSTEQRASVLRVIQELTAENIEKLKSIKAWDVLATFLEPLWQFDPNRKAIILSLAEAYARQRQEFLMENVLASLPQGDLDALRVRQVFEQQFLAREPSTEPVQEDNSQTYERSIALVSLGNHFIAPLNVGRYTLNLMIDTGASTTVISQQTFDNMSKRVSSEYVGTYQINTAGGRVNAPIFQLKQVFLAGFRLDNIAVVVLDLPDFTYADGLLGMNLLRQFDFKIDQQQQQLQLNRVPK
jgi:clan AA aspartic protease (TIGR02281 family)